MEQNPPPSYSYGPDWDDPGWREPIPPRKRSPIMWFIGLALAALLVWEVFTRTPTYEGRFFLSVDNEIAYGMGGTDGNSYADVLATLDANPQIKQIVLSHVPGTTHMAENVRIARLIRERGISTHLDNSSYIASGGVHLFMAGVERTMECGARIGVHSWKDSEGETPRSLGFDPAAPYMEAFYSDMGFPTDFYSFSNAAAPHEIIYFLKKDDIAQFNLLTEGACEKTGWFG